MGYGETGFRSDPAIACRRYSGPDAKMQPTIGQAFDGACMLGQATDARALGADT